MEIFGKEYKVTFGPWVVKNLENKKISLDDVFQTLKNTEEIKTESSFSKETDQFIFALSKEKDEIELALFDKKENVYNAKNK